MQDAALVRRLQGVVGQLVELTPRFDEWKSLQGPLEACNISSWKSAWGNDASLIHKTLDAYVTRSAWLAEHLPPTFAQLYGDNVWLISTAERFLAGGGLNDRAALFRFFVEWTIWFSGISLDGSSLQDFEEPLKWLYGRSKGTSDSEYYNRHRIRGADASRNLQEPLSRFTK